MASVKEITVIDPYIRYILIDDRWKIILARGLNIWSKTNGYFDIAETNQLYRSCMVSSMTAVEMLG